MEEVKFWKKDFVIDNEEACLLKLNELSFEERKPLRENLKLNEINKLVCLIGMITDSKEPEYYCKKYKLKTKDGSIRYENGKFSDKMSFEMDETPEEMEKNLDERKIFLVASHSSTNDWVNDINQATNESIGNIRKIDDDIKIKHDTYTVKAYENVDLPINSLVEIIGFLSVQPEKSTTDPPMETDGFGDENNDNISKFIIHAMKINELPHNNPLIDKDASNEEDIIQESQCEEIRKDLLKILTHFMFGDETAAEFVLCHLIANIYARTNGEVLGKFSINLTCQEISNNILSDHITKFYNFLETLVPNSVYFPLTIDNFNKTSFVPTKDYSSNRLQTGLLQLPKHTHLVLDETKLENGKLEQSGCLAVAELTEFIKLQQVNYDFKFYKIPFETNIHVMIWSEGKSLLPCDYIVPIKISDQESLRLVNENIAAGMHFIKPKLNIIRRYLTDCRLKNFEIAEEETKMIENDFVKMREEKNLEVEQLHSLLVLSRLIGISKGNKKLSVSAWEAAKALEMKRTERIVKKVRNES